MNQEPKRIIPCPENNDDCKYKNTPDGCMDSIHHIFPRRTADTPLKRRFGQLGMNKVISCRNIHDLLDRMPEPRYPNEAEMDRIIMRERDSG